MDQIEPEPPSAWDDLLKSIPMTAVPMDGWSEGVIKLRPKAPKPPPENPDITEKG